MDRPSDSSELSSPSLCLLSTLASALGCTVILLRWYVAGAELRCRPPLRRQRADSSRALPECAFFCQGVHEHRCDGMSGMRSSTTHQTDTIVMEQHHKQAMPIRQYCTQNPQRFEPDCLIVNLQCQNYLPCKWPSRPTQFQTSARALACTSASAASATAWSTKCKRVWPFGLPQCESNAFACNVHLNTGSMSQIKCARRAST